MPPSKEFIGEIFVIICRGCDFEFFWQTIIYVIYIIIKMNRGDIEDLLNKLKNEPKQSYLDLKIKISQFEISEWVNTHN